MRLTPGHHPAPRMVCWVCNRSCGCALDKCVLTPEGLISLTRCLPLGVRASPA
jgi:hypothetical protein